MGRICGTYIGGIFAMAVGSCFDKRYLWTKLYAMTVASAEEGSIMS